MSRRQLAVIDRPDSSVSRQCQVMMTGPLTPAQMLRWQDFVERCPSRAEALIWYSCPEGHEYAEEVCAGHVSPPGLQWCGPCAAGGLRSSATVIFVGWL